MAKQQRAERFQMVRVSGNWEELRGRDTKRGYVQRRDGTATVSVSVMRSESRNRDGKRIETACQTVTGDYSAVLDYVSTFPPGIRISSLRDRSGMVLESTY